MSKVFLMSDLHLGHANVCKFRPFASAEEHDGLILENIKTMVTKRDVLIFLGDVAFTYDAVRQVSEITALKKILILGNHDTERVHMSRLVDVYDQIHSLWSKRNWILSHAPIHESEIRDKLGVIHGHTHDRVIDDPRYINVCVEHTGYKPISWADMMENHHDRITQGV